jgi:hypothetical protein
MKIKEFKRYVRVLKCKCGLSRISLLPRKGQFVMCTREGRNGKYSLYYCPKIIKTMHPNHAVRVILHELGHIKLRTNLLEGIDGATQGEYLAECFCFEILKKYYPTIFKAEVEAMKRCLKSRVWRKKYPMYAAAYSHVPYYQEKKCTKK